MGSENNMVAVPGLWVPQIGERVEVTDIVDDADEWRRVSLWVCGVRVHDSGDGLDVSVTEQWPVGSRIALGYRGPCDGFRVGAASVRDDLRPLARLAQPDAQQGEGRYEARSVAGGVPTDCCDYGVVSLDRGEEVCRVWREDDARLIANLLSAQQGATSPASGEGVADALQALVTDVENGWGDPHTLRQAREAVAYLHTLHLEGGQTIKKLSERDGTDPRDAFGFPGRDYSPEYHVTTMPLYATPLAAATQPAVPQEGQVERAARAMCKADGLDPDEEIIGGQATGFENYGPLWQAEERSEGQLGLTNYKRLARAALTGAGENGEQGA